MSKSDLVKKLIFSGLFPLVAGAVILFLMFNDAFVLSLVLIWIFTAIWIIKGIVLTAVYGIRLITRKARSNDGTSGVTDEPHL